MTASKDILADRYSAKSSIHENAIIKKISLVSIIGNIIETYHSLITSKSLQLRCFQSS